MTEKVCSKCRILLPIGNFSKDNQQKSGYACACKKCRSEDKKTAYYRNHDLTLSKQREYWNKSKDEINLKRRLKNGGTIEPRVILTNEERIERKKERQKRFYEKNKERIRLNRKAIRLSDPFVLQKDKKYRERHHKKHVVLVKKWLKNNPEKAKIFNNSNTIKISNGYIAKIFNVPASILPTELIEAKREQLRLKRLLKQQP